MNKNNNHSVTLPSSSCEQGRCKGRAGGAAALRKNNFRALIWLYWSFKFHLNTQNGALTEQINVKSARFFSAPRSRGAYFFLPRPVALNWLATALPVSKSWLLFLFKSCLFCLCFFHPENHVWSINTVFEIFSTLFVHFSSRQGVIKWISKL